MTEVFRDLGGWREFRASRRLDGATLGFVPTMGALHEGHLSLIRRSKAENDKTLVSIFVNPTQFNDPGDLERYPRGLERDLELLRSVDADYLLHPSYEQLYPDLYRYRVQESELSRELCGGHRPGHFDGMLTVVLKLLNLSRADRAYFGEKDYQQYLLVRGMAEAFFLATEIIPCPTRRERDGLAMSSRNLNLGPAERTLAAEFPRLLKSAESAERARVALKAKGFGVDYVEERHGRRLAAVRVGSVRLIDNFDLKETTR